MSELDNDIKRLNTKLQQLLKHHQQIIAENGLLKKQAKERLDKEIQLQNTIAELEQKVNLLKAATGQLDAKDKAALEKNINKHLKEIQRCITFLSE